MSRAQPDPDVGLYVHVPFCARVCPYCDFAVVAAPRLEPQRERRYVDALLAELERSAADCAGRSLASLYLGGGTPSLLTAASVARIVEAAQGAFPCRAEIEITLETNPSTVERARLAPFREAGVNRISIGVQSFDDTVLNRLGRAHVAEEGRATIEAARLAGFENLSLDLIFGAPGSSPSQLERDLDEVVHCAPEHVSTYELTIESGTPFALALSRGQIARPDESAMADAMNEIERRLDAAGVARYEVSSHARPGYESRHNRRYWRREPVLGIGVGAWSSLPASPEALQGARRANHRDLGTYLECVESGRSPVAEIERLAPETARGEALFLGLRELGGMDAAAFAREFGESPRYFFETEIDSLRSAGLLEEAETGDLRLSRRGRLLADEVARHFV